MKSKFLAFVVTGIIMAVTGTAQTDVPAVRKDVQQKRIAGGVAKGSLTPHETKNLEGKEAGINRETRSDRKQDGGHLTGKEKAKVNHQQNGVSKDIYADKHNAAHQ
jgi:hypothetical protein